MSRLPAPMGLLIDRNQPLDFTFDGKPYQGFAGDSIASALLANGRFLLSRSFKYHRPRGPLTMAGQDANTLVQLPSEPNVLADSHLLESGVQVTGQNFNGSLDNDKDAYLGKFSKFMPVGFYYRSFYKPKGAWKLWEPISFIFGPCPGRWCNRLRDTPVIRSSIASARRSRCVGTIVHQRFPLDNLPSSAMRSG